MQPRRLPRCRRPSRASARRLGDHLNGVHRALLEARSAPSAAVVVEAVALTRAELQDRVLRTGTETPIAFETVPARQTARRLIGGSRRREAAHDLGEVRYALLRGELRLGTAREVAEVPQVELFEARQGMLSHRYRRSPQPGVDVVSRLLPVSYAR